MILKKLAKIGGYVPKLAFLFMILFFKKTHLLDYLKDVKKQSYNILDYLKEVQIIFKIWFKVISCHGNFGSRLIIIFQRILLAGSLVYPSISYYLPGF